jgi:hypothetical protein
MRTRTNVIYRGQGYRGQFGDEVTEDDLEYLKALYEQQAGNLSHLSFVGEDGNWYLFPADVLAESIIVIEVTEE